MGSFSLLLLVAIFTFIVFRLLLLLLCLGCHSLNLSSWLLLLGHLKKLHGNLLNCIAYNFLVTASNLFISRSSLCICLTYLACHLICLVQ